MNEIAYAINPILTSEKGCLVLDLIEVKKETYHYQMSSIPSSLSIAQWRLIAKQPLDKEAFTFLLKEEMAYQQRLTNKGSLSESSSLKYCHVSPSQVISAFKLLAPTQKLFCQNKQLVVDLYTKIEFYYEATALKTGQLEIIGRLKWRETDINLGECQAVGAGKPSWFVHGIHLKLIETSLNWKKLQELKIAPLLLEGTAKQKFLNEIEEEEEAPALIFKEGSLAELNAQTAPYPLLRLKDRWGACADLWMDYGNGHLIAFHDPLPFLKDVKGQIICRRQSNIEMNWEKDLLETDFIKKNVGSSHYYCPLHTTAKSLTFLLEIGWHIQDWQEKEVIKHTGTDLKFDEQSQSISVKGHLRYDTHEANVSQVIGVFNRRENFIQLSPYAVGLIPTDATYQAIQDLADESELVGSEIKIKKNQVNVLQPLWQHATISASLKDLKNKLENFTGIEETLPSIHFQGELRPYQQTGVNWLSFLYEYGFHGILADEMGLGKTVQILAFLSRLPQEDKYLIVMPTSLLFNWRNEIHAFLPALKCRIHQGPERARSKEELHDIHIILTSYTTLRLDLPLLQSFDYECVILDEAQVIKNAQTQTAQAVCQLKANLRLCLTGTPIENHLSELWSHFHFLIPDLFGTKEQFEADIQSAQADRRYLDRIKRKVTPFILRRRKREVAADLPERIDQVIWIEMTAEQRLLYEQLLAGFKSGLLKKAQLEGVGKFRLEILEAILRLRQMCCHPLLVSSLMNQETDTLRSSKFDALFEDLETLIKEGYKVLVYSQFTSMLKLMAKEANERQWSYSYLDGSTKNREEVVHHFQNDPSQFLFFISLKAGGVGLNLTAADYVYLYDPWWNEALEDQAINRAHRIGRKDIVISKRFVMTESIEEKMMKLKEAKRVVIEDLLDTENPSSQLSIDDLQFLLS